MLTVDFWYGFMSGAVALAAAEILIAVLLVWKYVRGDDHTDPLD